MAEKAEAPKQERDVIPPKGQQSYVKEIPPPVEDDKAAKSSQSDPVKGK